MSPSYKNKLHPEVLVLFDVDGTLTPAREVISSEMISLLKEARKHFVIGFVGGSDLKKQKEQLGSNCLSMFEYCFSENGILAFKDEVLMHTRSFVEYLGEKSYQELCNAILEKLSKMNLPFKRGTFIELRTGLLNVAPPGRSCLPKERDEFEEYDTIHKIRAKFVEDIKDILEKSKLGCSLGGQISVDIFPKGWDKTYCLQHIKDENFSEIHFFGNKYLEGENDYEIINHSSVIGHRVDSPEDTMTGLKSLINKFS